MLKEAFWEDREDRERQGILGELKGMLVLSSLAHILALALMVLLAAYFPQRRPPEVPVYTVNLVDLAGPARKSGRKGLKKGRPSQEVGRREGKPRSQEISLPKLKEEKREVKKAEAPKKEALKKLEPKEVKRPEVKPKPKKIALAEKEKKEEPAREARPEVREARREERPIGREAEPPSPREAKGERGKEGASGGPQPAVAPLVISRGDGGDGGVYKGSLFLDSNFPFKSYLNRIRDKIGSNWNPVGGYLPSEGKKVIVAFKILKDGRISSPQVEKPSGISFLDLSALRAVLDSQPFPPLPSEFNQDALGVHFGFEYVDEG